MIFQTKQPVKFKVSICICTYNRPGLLKKSLDSIVESSIPVFETIVSDDSDNLLTKNMVKTHYPLVKYFKSLQDGLVANRNFVAKKATGGFIMFLDDDATLDRNFLKNVRNFLLAQNSSDQELNKTIVTGQEKQWGMLVQPNKQDFLGFQSVPYGKQQKIETICINSTVFPRQLFNEIQFDRLIKFGYDEVDIATQAIRKNYKIIFCPQAINTHYISSKRDGYRRDAEAGRVYITWKKYYQNRQFLKSAFFLLLITLNYLFRVLKKPSFQYFKISLNGLYDGYSRIFAYLKS